ncbi:hypothetical protein ACIBF7_44640 [Nonomuraea sp. NPDC050478]|uniref:hypothetical protein n=1 Tax=Nonomuraea sp. NPDC050478 TaxID=3364365 RepID=UPI00379F4CCA
MTLRPQPHLSAAQTGLGQAVSGGRRLSGTVAVDGSKNGALPLLAAAAALSRTVTVTHLPACRDVTTMTRLLRAAGTRTEPLPGEPGTLRITPAPDLAGEADWALAALIRASYYLVPALLACGRAVLPWPGGCSVGERGMELHLAVYEAFGDTVRTDARGYRITPARSASLTPVEITLPFPSRGATVVALLRALVAGRALLLRTPNTSPEVTSLVAALGQAGHQVTFQEGQLSMRPSAATTFTGPVRWQVPGDKIEAGTLLCALAATGGDGHVTGVDPDHLRPLLNLLTELGFAPAARGKGVGLAAPATLSGAPMRAIASLASLAESDCLDADFEPPLMALALTLPGRHTFADEINPGRHANLLPQLRRLGAVITETSPMTCHLRGPQRLSGAEVVATDIRTGSALLLAALTARGTTRIDGLDQVQRGHADLPGKLRSLGADITSVASED